jgi:hypothetical protein
MPTILPPFLQYPNEAAIIARLLAGYTVLEQDLLNCVQVVIGNFDTVLKSLFRIRGEARRIDEGERIGQPVFLSLNLGAEFHEAITALRYCRLIRNQYAHCRWWDDNSGQLAFANLEDLARLPNVVPDYLSLVPKHVDMARLQAQETFYIYTDKILRWVNYEGRTRAKILPSHTVTRPPQLPPPPL